MLLYKRFYLRRICMCIILVSSAMIILSSFRQIGDHNIYQLKTTITRRNTQNDDINTVSKQNWPVTMDYSQISDSQFKPFCTYYSPAYKKLIQPDAPTNFTDWSYKRKRKCQRLLFPTNLKNIKRLKYTLKCFDKKAKLFPSFTNSSRDIQIIALNSACLSTFIDNCCTDNKGVPNVVHYVWYFHKEMNFYMFLSVMSVIRFIRPCLILFHGNFLPHGKYWDYVTSIFPNILHVKRPRPLTIFGKKIHFHPHSGDFMRIEAVKSLGGIYFDADVIVLRDLEPLREYNMTLCYQANGYLHSAFVMGKKNATFLNLWIDGYRKDYRNESYTYNAMVYNKKLAKSRRDLIHVENGTLCRPKAMIGVGKDTDPKIVYNWSTLFGYHLYARFLNVSHPRDVNWIKKYNTTLGSMARHILYGNKELCK